MHRIILAVVTAIALIVPTTALAGQIWTDGDGDGLPDQAKLFVFPSTNLTVDVWIDTQSYAFTYFQTWIERPLASHTSAVATSYRAARTSRLTRPSTRSGLASWVATTPTVTA